MSDFLPEDIKRFLTDYIDSIAELEALLFLREHHDRTWTSGSVAERIYTNEAVTATLLAKLAKRGLVTADEGVTPAVFRFAPRHAELSRLIDHMALVYSKYLVPVTLFVHKKSRRNIEGFADAFNLRKDQEDKA